MIPSINLIRQLVRALSVKRAQVEKNRLYVGQLLHSIDDSLKSDWKLFCGLSNQSDIGQCEQLNQIWDSFTSSKTEKLSIMCLYQWVSEDNPIAYQNFIQRLLMSQSPELLSQPNGIAYLVSLFLPNQYRYIAKTSGPTGIWYEFTINSGLWQKLSKEELMGKIVSQCQEKYSDLIAYYNSQLRRDNLNQRQIKQSNLIVTHLARARRLLLTVSYRKEIVTCLQEICADSQIIEKFDRDRGILKFTNGTYDLNTGQFKHHDSDDYCSLSTNFSFTNEEIETDYEQAVNDFLWKIFPRDQTRKQALTMMAQCLRGRPLNPSNRKCFVWLAQHSTGCRTLLQLLKLTLGKYCQLIPGHQLANVEKETPNPYIEFSNCPGARAVIIDFDDEKLELSETIIGPCLYNNTLKYRQLYHSEVQMPIQFQLILVGNGYCGSMPYLEDDDRPYESLDFESKFVDEPNGQFEFKADRQIAEKLPLWASAFMSILLNHVD